MEARKEVRRERWGCQPDSRRPGCNHLGYHPTAAPLATFEGPSPRAGGASSQKMLAVLELYNPWRPGSEKGVRREGCWDARVDNRRRGRSHRAYRIIAVPGSGSVATGEGEVRACGETLAH